MAPFIREQTRLEFGPIRITNGWTLTNGPGIRPGACVVSLLMDDVDRLTSPIQDLSITEGRGDPKFTLTDAHLVAANTTLVRAKLVRCTIFDRRWRWEYAYIDGDYNQRLPDGSFVREKTPRELVSLVLDSMGETNYDVSQLPDTTRPRVNWQSSRSDAALLSICGSLGCYPCLNYATDKVEIHEIGTGVLPSYPGELPEGALQDTRSVSVKPQPFSLRVVGGPSRFQTRLRLEAVGIDTDGTVKLLDDLSYVQDLVTAGDLLKNEAPGFFGNVPGTYMVKGKPVLMSTLAAACIYKMYRVSGQGGRENAFGDPIEEWFPTALEDSEYKPSSLKDLLPIGSTKLSIHYDKDGAAQENLATIHAAVDDGYSKIGLDIESEKEGTQYPEGEYQIDGARGIVIFSKPVFKFDEEANEFLPAEIELDTSYGVNKEGVVVRWEEFINNADENSFGSERLKVPGLVSKVSEVEDDPLDNREDISDDAQRYLAAMSQRYLPQRGGDYTYESVIHIPISGIVRQVTYQGGGGGITTTRFSANMEHSPYIPSFEDDTFKRLSADKADTFIISDLE